MSCNKPIIKIFRGKGGQLPQTQNSANLPQAIATIPQGSENNGPICTIAGKTIYQVTGVNSSGAVTFWTPVSSGQQIKTNTYRSAGLGPVQVSHFTQVMFVPKK